MNLRELRYFCEVVETGSAVQAATRLFVAPTAISMQLGQLEKRLGGALFDRSRRPMTLTEFGRFFYPRARQLLLDERQLEEEARVVAAGKRGWLGIGFVRSTIYAVMPNAVRAFREANPDVQLDLVELLSEHQPAHLRSGRLHLGISRFLGAYDQPPDLRHVPLFEDPFVAVLPRDHRLARRSALRLADLSGLPLISYPKDPQTSFAAQVLAMLHAAGVEPRVAHETIEIQTAFGLVAAGLGVALTGASVIEHNRTDVAFVPISDLTARTRVVAVTRANEDNPLVAAFLAKVEPPAGTRTPRAARRTQR
jgi:DNA-binding transcriptional LysR family regulator